MSALELAKIAFKEYRQIGEQPFGEVLRATYTVRKALSEFDGKYGLFYANRRLEKNGEPVFTCIIDVANGMVQFCTFDNKKKTHPVGYCLLKEKDRIEEHIAVHVSKFMD